MINRGAVNVEIHTQPKKLFRKQRNEKGYNKPPFTPRNPNNKRNNSNGQKTNKCFRCGLESHFIDIFLKPDTSNKKFHWNTKKPKICAYISKKIDKTPENITEEIKSQKIYAPIAHMYSNSKSPRNNYGDRSQLTNMILDSGATCHMTTEISYLYQAHCWKQIYISKLQMRILSQRNKQEKFK